MMQNNIKTLNISKSIVTKRINLVSPWKNKKEFKQVYDWIYGESSNKDTKKLACKRMIIWKTRRHNLTPASILGTLVILQVRLRDDDTVEDKQKLIDLKSIYSSAFTRFLNYMSSIMQTRDMKSMYETANELGLNSFLVDLRHLCSHGQSLPSIDVFRNTSDYCLKWIKSFYWGSALETMMDVDATSLRQKFRSEFDTNLSELFSYYDTALEAHFKEIKSIEDIKKLMTKEKKVILRKYSELKYENSIIFLLNSSLDDMKQLVEKELMIRDLKAIYLEAFFKMEYFFELGANAVSDVYANKALKINQRLFHFVATFGFIEDIFDNFIDICENRFEPIVRRKGSKFWANMILDGFNALQDFKILYKAQRDNHPNIQYPIAEIKSKKLKKIYEDLGIDMEKTLIFNDTLERPWHINISKSYIEKRTLYINEYTVDILKKCLNLVDPPFSSMTHDSLLGLINSYCGQIINDEDNKSTVVEMPNSKVYTLHEDILKINTNDIEMSDVNNTKKYGIWSTVSDGEEWHTCALGRLIWE